MSLCRLVIPSFTLKFLFIFSWNAYSGGDLTIYISLFVPLGMSLILTFIFYIKGILILRGQQEYSLKSTKSYIRSLAWYSFSQIVTYGPFVIYLFLSGFYDFGPTWSAIFAITTQNLAGLSGFFSAMIFLCQGPLNSQKPLIHQNDDENDLTQDLI